MKKSIIVFLMLLLLGACSNEKEKVIFPADNSASLKPIMQKQETIHGYKSVINEENILVAININRFARFNKTKIEEKITKQIEKQFPERQVLVTGDQKIMWEVESIIDKKLKEEDLKKSIEKIKSLSKEET
ncbi:YhcN/YlaJ family sporulation lipoprotein [Psychrobacillus antarcticus]|uniref:YhcN/YlaJ family sporulation lipoprotein n=1 Tax=Psychrobacillus antarcticus TaxID=2879115 RepID=UPI0024081272|nr:YhcN/YlaJ family sporulation lipoprotein [Psychrobacillus antarcticus]